ncbi:MAG TPA: carbamoyltransferase HypF, partial [Porphyromonadaceae bacterium]|nr:carbamoyltransferase HypF [Porphyromonadaceae bacterium]
MDKLHYTLHIEGLVQGVGFRPFVYKLATGMHLCGNVSNRTDGVYVDLNASSQELESFVERLNTEKPEVAFIYKINVHRPKTQVRYNSFKIIPSLNETSQITQVSPDIAVCEDCMTDIRSQQHRVGYPFVNCTHCGPRFSIVKALPYDRANTTMQSFAMCRRCSHEYHDVSDRRFHAQPTACNSCGPVYYIHTPGDFSYSEILDRFSIEVNAGNLVA